MRASTETRSPAKRGKGRARASIVLKEAELGHRRLEQCRPIQRVKARQAAAHLWGEGGARLIDGSELVDKFDKGEAPVAAAVLKPVLGEGVKGQVLTRGDFDALLERALREVHCPPPQLPD